MIWTKTEPETLYSVASHVCANHWNDRISSENVCLHRMNWFTSKTQFCKIVTYGVSEKIDSYKLNKIVYNKIPQKKSFTFFSACAENENLLLILITFF